MTIEYDSITKMMDEMQKYPDLFLASLDNRTLLERFIDKLESLK